MKKALLVIDAQDDFIGEQRNKKKFDYENDIDELIDNINEAITSYYEKNDEVVYIAHVIPSSYINRKFITKEAARTQQYEYHTGNSQRSHDYRYI